MSGQRIHYSPVFRVAFFGPDGGASIGGLPSEAEVRRVIEQERQRRPANSWRVFYASQTERREVTDRFADLGGRHRSIEKGW